MYYEGMSSLTGTNILDVTKIGIYLALLTSNASLITEAYSRINAEVSIHSDVKVDGIKPPTVVSASNSGLLYNGNYGAV